MDGARPYYVRLSAVQRHPGTLPTDQREPVLEYFRTPKLLAFGWDLYAGRVVCGPGSGQSGGDDERRLLVTSRQAELFLSQVLAQSQTALAPIARDELITASDVDGLEFVTKTSTEKEFRAALVQRGLKYKEKSKALMTAEQREAQRKKAELKQEARRQAAMDRRVRMLAELKMLVATGSSTAFVCIDLEAYERNQNLVTEVGIATLDLQSSAPGDAPDVQHFRVREHLHLRNGRYVADNADKFEFGSTRVLSLAECKQALDMTFERFGSRLAFVGHDAANDVRYLRQLGVRVPEHVPVFDTREIWYLLQGDSGTSNLGIILEYYRLGARNLHNAGNDAYWTLVAMMKMAVG